VSRILSIIVTLACIAITVLTVSTTPAQAAAHSADWYGNSALSWAESHAYNHWYASGGTGPDYDCSGLVMVSFEHVGIKLPRTTYGMLSSKHLRSVPLSRIRRGDILFYGSGHVEFATKWYHQSFGAHDTGSRIGWIKWWPGSWQPTMAFEVIS